MKAELLKILSFFKMKTELLKRHLCRATLIITKDGDPVQNACMLLTRAKQKA